MTAGSWLKEHFQDGDAERIQQAVIAAEKKTKGDIVPMVVHRSSNLSYVAPTLFLLFLSGLLLVGTRYVTEDLEQSFYIFALAAAFLSLILALILARLPAVQRLIIPGKTQAYDVHQRAELEFYRNHFDQTKSHGAVLIFISLLERQVVVLCDESFAVPPGLWTACNLSGPVSN